MSQLVNYSGTVNSVVTVTIVCAFADNCYLLFDMSHSFLLPTEHAVIITVSSYMLLFVWCIMCGHNAKTEQQKSQKS